MEDATRGITKSGDMVRAALGRTRLSRIEIFFSLGQLHDRTERDKGGLSRSQPGPIMVSS
jgi:hypothetical protein